jgi:hypothetical protein
VVQAAGPRKRKPALDLTTRESQSEIEWSDNTTPDNGADTMVVVKVGFAVFVAVQAIVAIHSTFAPIITAINAALKV